MKKFKNGELAVLLDKIAFMIDSDSGFDGVMQVVEEACGRDAGFAASEALLHDYFSAAVKTKEEQRAIEKLGMWAEINKNALTARCQARLLIRVDDFAAAEKILKRISSDPAMRGRCLHDTVVALVKQDKKQEALELLEEAKTADFVSAEVYKHLGQVRILLKQRDLGEKELRQALNMEPFNPSTADVLCVLLHEQGRLLEEAEVLKVKLSHTKDRKERAEILLSIGSLLDEKGRKKEAGVFLEQAAALGNARAFFELGSHIFRKDADKALALLAKGLKLNPESAELHFATARVLAGKKEKEYDAAVSFMMKAIELSEEKNVMAGHLIALGQLLSECGRHEEAVHALGKCVNMGGTEIDVMLWSVMADSLAGLERYGEAEAVLRTAVLTNPKHPSHVELRVKLMTFYFKCRDFENAAKEAGNILELSPDHCIGLHVQGMCRVLKDPFDAAGIVMLKKAAMKDENSPFFKYFLARALLKSGGPTEDVLMFLEDTVKLDPGFGPAFSNMAELYERLGKNEAAAKCREQAAKGRDIPEAGLL